MSCTQAAASGNNICNRSRAAASHARAFSRMLPKPGTHMHSTFFLGSWWIVPPCAGGFFPFVFSAAGWPVNGLSAVDRPSTEPGGPTTWCNLFLILAHRVWMGDRGGYSRRIRPPPLLPRLSFLCYELRRGGAIPVGFGVLLALGYPPSQIGFGIGMWGLFQ